MSVQSPCKIEFVPDGGTAIVLVDAGDWLVRLPRFEPAQEMFEVPGIDAGEHYFKPLGGVAVSIILEREQPEASYPVAADAFAGVDSAGTVELLNTDGVLVITGESTVATYTPAIVAGITPGLPFGPEASVTKVYQILAGLPAITPNIIS